MSAPVERVYIGGLDPSRLSVEDVLRRLQRTLQDQVELRHQIATKKKSYCHFDVVSLQTDCTALEAIRKLYNNVTWKGCKIRVQAAEPTFLERLARERQERLEKRQANPPTVTTKATLTAIPRHLKVKRTYGEGSWNVDTKPVEVTDWSAFAKMRNRLLQKQQELQQQRRQQQQQKSQSKNRKGVIASAARRKTYQWNRAVRLCFVGRQENRHDRARSSDGQPVESFTASSSDADDAPDESNDVSSTTGTTDDDSDAVSSTSSKTDDDSTSNGAEILQTLKSSRAKASAYIWSDSSSDEEMDDMGSKKRQGSLVPADYDDRSSNKLVMDEFAAGMERDDSNSYDRQESESDSDAIPTLDLEKDVQTNLSVLAELFPDLSGRKPAEVVGAKDTTNKNSSNEFGWGSQGGIMLRYDPTKQSSGQFVLVKPPDDETASQSSASGRDGESNEESMHTIDEESNTSGDEERLRNDETEKEKMTVNIYEEGKLEKVFRQSGEHTVQIESNANSSRGGFSFGFQLDNEKVVEQPLKPSSATSFSDTAPEVTAKTAKDQPIVVEDSSKIREDEMLEASMEDRDAATRKRRRGFCFPSEDIDRYVEHFYSLNEGKRIREDLEGFKSDPRVQDSWERQRKILTQDWKRKRKHALAKRRKRY